MRKNTIKNRAHYIIIHNINNLDYAREMYARNWQIQRSCLSRKVRGTKRRKAAFTRAYAKLTFQSYYIISNTVHYTTTLKISYFSIRMVKTFGFERYV